MSSDITVKATRSVEERILEHVDREAEQAVEFLEAVVNINSGTMNHEGVRRVGALFRQQLEPLGFNTRWIPMQEVNRAGHLLAERAGSRGRRLLLVGHLDTVYEAVSPFQTFRRRGRHATGPGVVDMKGGDVVMLFALRALAATGTLEETSITIALMGDEEDAGQPLSIARRDLWEAAEKSDVGLGFEMSGATPATATVARRGASSWMLRVQARAGHSSRIFHPDFGAGAIFEISRVLHQCYEALSSTPNLTLSPGVMLGGTEAALSQDASGSVSGKYNVIPSVAAAAGDLRFISSEQRQRAKHQIEAIVSQHLAHCQGTIVFNDAYPAMSPKPGNYNLLDELDRISRGLGAGRIHAYDPAERGAADISFVADRVEACLDGLGPAGWGDHTYEETVDLSSLPLQTKKAALLILQLTGGRSSGLNT